jgi:AraC-like DNA-binding protein
VTYNSASYEHYFIKLVEQVIVDHLSNENFSVEDLCDVLRISRSTLHRKISFYANSSSTKFINNVKLNHSKKLLCGSTLHISEIAYEVGFRDPNYFTRLFTKEFGINPSEYRNQIRN